MNRHTSLPQPRRPGAGQIGPQPRSTRDDAPHQEDQKPGTRHRRRSLDLTTGSSARITRSGTTPEGGEPGVAARQPNRSKALGTTSTHSYHGRSRGLMNKGHGDWVVRRREEGRCHTHARARAKSERGLLSVVVSSG
jgi:hypothetical protein